MPNGQNGKDFPTMIIPQGTEIKVNEKGQLSIRTPGNLVIQNSGNYSLIQSENGSIRIEDHVNVEAIDVQAKDTCFVQGKLTAWRVKANKLSLENSAEAYVMLRESEDLDVAKTARLVGNFASEREVYLLLGRFSQQLRSLPDTIPMGGEGLAVAREEPVSGHDTVEVEHPAASPPSGETAPPPAADTLQLAVVILEREIARGVYGDDSQQALIEIHHALQERSMDKLRQLFSVLSGQVKDPGPDLNKAFHYIREAL